MAVAFDFSGARPDPAEIVAAGGSGALAYLGSGKPRPDPGYIAALHAAGLWFVFIQESYASRAYEGYDAGAVDAHVAEADADAAGYPEECAIYVALGDTNRGDAAAHVAGIAEYARGFGDALRRPVFGGYGSREAVDAACAAQPKMQFRWTVETWGANFEGYDHIVQMANTPSPIADTDLDQTFQADVGQWPRPGGAPPAPPTPRSQEDDMDLYQTVVTANGAEFTVARGSEGHVWVIHRLPDGTFEKGDSGDWIDMGGNSTAQPTITYNAHRKVVSIHARGTEGQLWWRTWSVGSPRTAPDWATHGGHIVAAPIVPAS